MLLKRLQIRNYKQHDKLDITFDGNVIGVIGPNGRGKSNLLGALHFAFGGEQPGSKKSDLLKWGAATGSVELDFEHQGLEGKIYRELHSSTAKFTYGGDEYNGITKVADAILERIGLDKDLLKQAIFVRQAEIDAILFTDPRIRELAFQKLCGIGDAAKIHKKLGEIIGEMKNPPNYDEQIAEGQQRHKEMHDRLKGLKETQKTVTEQRAKAPELSAMQANLTNLESMRATLTNLGKVQYDAVNTEIALNNTRTELGKLNVRGEVNIDVLDGQIAGLRIKVSEAEAYAAKFAAFEAAGQAMIALGDAPAAKPMPFSDAEVETMKESFDLYQHEMTVLGSEFQTYAKMVDALQDGGDGDGCPICGGPLNRDEVLKKHAELKATLEQKQVAYNDAKSKWMEAAAARQATGDENQKAQSEYDAAFKVNMAKYQEAETALNGLEKPGDLGELSKELQELEATRSKAVTAIADHTRLTTEEKNHAARLEELRNEEAGLLKRLGEFEGVKKAYDTGAVDGAMKHVETSLATMTQQLKELQELDQHVAQLNGMITELQNNMGTLENTMAILEQKRAQLDTYSEVVKTLTSVRDWFHYANGPHTLATSILEDMTADVNRFLGQFTAPFSVLHADETLGFKCLFHDGREMPSDGPPDATHLSGGEKVQLAVSFRFASYCMFANKLGLLSLDEPTVYLDEANVGRFCTLLERIKEVAQQMNLQVIIATHERAVMPFMDTVIDLT